MQKPRACPLRGRAVVLRIEPKRCFVSTLRASIPHAETDQLLRNGMPINRHHGLPLFACHRGKCCFLEPGRLFGYPSGTKVTPDLRSVMPYALKADTRKARQLTRLQKAALNTTGGLMHANNQPTQDTSDPHQKATFNPTPTLRKLLLEYIAERNTIEKWKAENALTCPYKIYYAVHERLKKIEERSATLLQLLKGLGEPW